MNDDTPRRAIGRVAALSVLVVLSAVATSAAFAGATAADGHDVDATLGDATYEEVGDEATVRLDLRPAGEDSLAYDGGYVELEYDDALLEFVEVRGEESNVLVSTEEEGTIAIAIQQGELPEAPGLLVAFEVAESFEATDVTLDPDESGFALDREQFDVRWTDGTITRAGIGDAGGGDDGTDDGRDGGDDDGADDADDVGADSDDDAGADGDADDGSSDGADGDDGTADADGTADSAEDGADDADGSNAGTDDGADADDGSGADDGSSEADDGSDGSDESLPGFGPAVAVVALLAAALALGRRS